MSDSYKCKLRGKHKRATDKHKPKFVYGYVQNYKLNPRWRRWEKNKDEPYLIKEDTYRLRRFTLPSNDHPWDQLSEKDKLVISNYSRNPSWWNYLTSTIKKRRITRDKLKTLTRDNAEEIDNFPGTRKPMVYFW